MRCWRAAGHLAAIRSLPSVRPPATTRRACRNGPVGGGLDHCLTRYWPKAMTSRIRSPIPRAPSPTATSCRWTLADADITPRSDIETVDLARHGQSGSPATPRRDPPLQQLFSRLMPSRDLIQCVGAYAAGSGSTVRSCLLPNTRSTNVPCSRISASDAAALRRKPRPTRRRDLRRGTAAVDSPYASLFAPQTVRST